jgi:hypothetical protein
MKLVNVLAAPLYAALLAVFVVLAVLAGYVALLHHVLHRAARAVKRTPSLRIHDRRMDREARRALAVNSSPRA